VTAPLLAARGIVVRFGEPIQVEPGAGRAGREALVERVREGMLALLPDVEPTYPRRRPGGDYLSDLFNGRREAANRREYMAELEREAAG